MGTFSGGAASVSIAFGSPNACLLRSQLVRESPNTPAKQSRAEGEKEKTKCVIYARYSSDNQREESLKVRYPLSARLNHSDTGMVFFS
jgi:hypothetical protein